MDMVTLDFETFWSTQHSLRRMTAIEYVMHEKTQIISCSFKVNDGETFVLFGDESIRSWLRAQRWSETAVLAHNTAEFDALVLAWRFGIRPRLWLDTAAMARPLFAKTTGVSLKALCKHLGIGIKDNTALVDTKGKRLEDFTPQDLAHMKVYNRDDTELCYALFKKLRSLASRDELWLIDATIRMMTELKFDADIALLEAAQSVERDRKLKDLLTVAQAIDATVTDVARIEESLRSVLASAAKFSQLLTALGVEVPMKPSPTNPANRIPALAKTDDAMVALVEHPDEVVAAAAQARLSVRSTIVETRLQRFVDAARSCGGKMPVALRYCGADTTGRWSGIMSMNMQNMPRINWDNARDPANALRNSLRAPEGHRIIVADLSGIEMRVNMFLWKVPYAMEMLSADPENADLYKQLAADEFGVPYDEVTDPQRRAGKAQILGCGFGLGSAEKFVGVAQQMAGIQLTLEEAQRDIAEFRRRHPQIKNAWYACQDKLPHMQRGATMNVDPWGLVKTAKHSFILPSGRRIFYPHMRSKADGYWPSGDRKTAWLYGTGRNTKYLWGGLLVENIVQALARDVVAGNAISFYKKTGLRPQHTVHDELIYVVKEEEAQQRLDELQAIMRTPPTWWPELAVWSEGGIGKRYGEIA